MSLTRTEREEMKALSMELFGVSSKWKSIMEKGMSKTVTRKSLETVPGENGEPDTTKEVEVPVLTSSGAQQSYTHRPTVEELKVLLLDLKSQRDNMIAEREKVKAEMKAKKDQETLAREVQAKIAGSAL